MRVINNHISDKGTILLVNGNSIYVGQKKCAAVTMKQRIWLDCKKGTKCYFKIIVIIDLNVFALLH